MTLGQPDLYIAGRKLAAGSSAAVTALAGLKIRWGTDNPVDMPPASTLSGQLLVRGTIPPYLDVGADVGLVDPATSRCLFAGKLQPLTARRDEQLSEGMRIGFTAASPVAELEKHNMIDLYWAGEGENSAARLPRLRAAMPRGWSLAGGENGATWTMHGTQKYQSVRLLDLLTRYVRGNNQRYADTSVYVPGAGLQKRLTITGERATRELPRDDPGVWGQWLWEHSTAVLPASAVSDQIDWEKTPDDLVTGVQVTTWGKWLINPGEDDESAEWEWPLDWAGDNSAAREAQGISTVRIETMLSPQYRDSTLGAVQQIGRQWLNSATGWRPTSLELPDSRRIGTQTLVNLLAVDTRSTVAITVPQAAGLPAAIRAYVLAGTAEWTGRQWITNLTLGRTQ